ncbi:hypothetical protein PQX77_004094 [Marasmius sp. AFHP31]|nr:hypothetical protein PQX77_004094 [Marasmius sp. AFHP31]
MHRKKVLIHSLIVWQDGTAGLYLLKPLVFHSLKSISFSPWIDHETLKAFTQLSPHLKHLTMQMTPSKHSPRLNNATQPHLDIATLSILVTGDYRNPFSACPSTPSIFPQLTHLHLDIDISERASGKFVQSFLSTTSRSLQYLFLGWTPFEIPVQSAVVPDLGKFYLDLSHFTNLRALQMSFCERQENTPQVAGTVSSCQNLPALRSVILLRPPGDSSRADHKSWGGLDLKFSDSAEGYFPSLKEVVVRSPMMSLFPTCLAKGLIRPAEPKFSLKKRWLSSRAVAYEDI